MKLNQNHLFLTSSHIVKSIIKPLEKYDIFHFDYCKSYSDGSHICLTTNPDHLQAYYSEKHYLKGSTEASPALYTKGAVLCSTLPNQKIFKWARDNFQTDHALYLINPSTDYCEFFSFASFPEYFTVINFYLNNIDILQAFTGYFKEQTASLINIAEKHKLVYAPHNKPIKSYKSPDLNWIEKHQCQHIQSGNHTSNPLTKRQHDCAKHLLNGLNYREIALKLNLSVRTIETHVDYLKTKFNCRNKTELVLRLSKILP